MMVVLIVLIVFAFITFNNIASRKHKMEEMRLTSQAANDDELTQLRAQVVRMEERIRTLETIVTDEGYQVGQAIENLK
ncbi:hypothetical protein [Gallaecimonas sp. GXIMD4217]|uniref:hypothetical protein n=1 Tax=Gallaecimonas sp. GXIMD4217 TaxID=3131927 RepID=UPI00311B2551